MAVPTTFNMEESLDVVLQQQLISSTFRVRDRVQRQVLSVPGTKAAFKALKEAILAGYRASNNRGLDGFIDFCQERFHVQKQLFDEKMATLPKNDDTVDERLKFIMIVSALRDYWQDMAYESVLAEIGKNLRGRGYTITRDELNSMLSQRYGSEFSLMVNLYEIRLWGQLTCTPLKIRSPRLKILNTLVGKIAKELDVPGH